MVNFFIHRPIFASAIAIIMVLAGSICYFLLPVSQFPDITPPQVVVSAELSRRERAGRRRHGDDAARGADQRRRGHDLHVVGELERRLVDDHHHLRRRLSPRYRRGRRAESRLAGRLVAAGDRQSGRRDDQEAESELRSDRQSDLARRLGRSGRALQLRLSADRRSAEAAARASATCRSSASAAIRCASGSIPTSSPISASRRSTFRTRSPNRTSRSRRARSASRRRRPARRSKCRSTPPAGSAIPKQFGDIVVRADPAKGAVVRLRDVARIELGALQYSSCAFFGKDPTVVLAVFQMPGSNALDLQQRVKDKMQELSKRFPPGIAYAMHYDTTRFVSAAMHDVVITLARGAGARRSRRLRLPAELAHDDHPDDRHSGVADRDARGDGGARLLAQHAEPARHGAGDRPRRRRRDRRGRKCRAPARGRPAAAWRRPRRR